MTSAVCSTSSPSSMPEMVVSPTVSAPRIRTRCEIDLSPGTRARPCKGPTWRAGNGGISPGCTGGVLTNCALLPCTCARRHPGDFGPLRWRCAIDSSLATSQVKHRFERTLSLGTPTVAKPDLGTKRVCPDTGRKFYDLNKNPVISPYTGKVVPIAAPTP